MIGGFGAIGAINRFDQTKKEGADATASASPRSESVTGADSKSASVLSSLSKPNASKNSRSSDVSKENAKDFSRVLNETEKSEKNDKQEDSLAGALSTPTNSRPVERVRSEPTKPTSESAAGSTSEISSTPRRVDADAKPESKSAESIDERVSTILQSLNETSDTETSMRHMSMQDFLSKMKNEFGVEPQAIVEAFANLDRSALMAPPDQTAQAVLSQLNLSPEQMPKAERLYREMLNQTGESALNETLAGVDAGISLQVMSEQDLAMDRLQKSISNLNDSFARRDGVSPKSTEEALLAASLGAPTAMALEVSKEAPADAGGDSVLDKSLDSNSKIESTSTKAADLSSALQAALGASVAASPNSADASNSGGSNSGSQSETPKLREFGSIESALASAGFPVPTNTTASATPLMAGTSTSLANALATGLANQSGDASSANAQDIIRNAQILMKNGGGEMKMQLKPEGVGDVTLKVAVKDGQVGIQMVTENDSAKKALESGLEDLKTSLAQHKLHVDAVKIEVGTEMAKQRFEQAQQDASRDQARQMAQDFMGQFRQDREGFRQGFSDMSGSRGYQQPKRNSLPEIEPTASGSVSNSKTNGERRLNLVA